MATVTQTIGESSYERRMRIFEQELQPHYLGLYGFAYRLTNDETAAADLVQETFMRAWKSIDRFVPGSNARAWLYTICRNAFINDYRQASRRLKTEDYDEVVANHQEDDIDQPTVTELHEDLYFRLMGDEVTHALGALNPDQRVIVLLDLDDFTYEEIAAIVDCKIGTVRSRLSRAREVLKQKLYDYAVAQGFVSGSDPKLIA